ncbi:MAG TPA: winged helix-turn-helix transcriptional regulator [Nitrososphaeraceae archaeon]
MNEERILQFIESHPGTYVREIRRSLEISMGSTQYNLYRLENKNKVVSLRRGLHKFYFLRGVFGDHEKNILQILNQGTSRKILLAIIEGNNPTQTDIVDKVGISYASLHRHIELLLKFKIIKEEPSGRHKRYLLYSKRSTHLILALFKNYYSNSWLRWSEGLADMYLALSEDPDIADADRRSLK